MVNRAVGFNDTTLSTFAKVVDLGKSTKVSLTSYKCGTYNGETASLLVIRASHITRKSNSATVNYKFELRLQPAGDTSASMTKNATSWVLNRLHLSNKKATVSHPSPIEGGDILPRQDNHTSMTGVPAASNPHLLKRAALDVVVPPTVSNVASPEQANLPSAQTSLPHPKSCRQNVSRDEPANPAHSGARTHRESAGQTSAQPDGVLTIGAFGPSHITLPNRKTTHTAHHTGLSADASATGGVTMAQLSGHLGYETTADWESPDSQYVMIDRVGETLSVSVIGPGKKGQGIPISISLALVVIHTIPARLRVFPSTTTPLRSLLTFTKSHLRPHPRKRENFILTCGGGQEGKECSKLCDRFEGSHMTQNVWRSMLRAGPVQAWVGNWVLYV